ncbi:MAG TPA: glycosyltransferase family 39 protein [Flavobacteriales bacterium]|nr:glycosyltransferase family 39 protein [Flavobacteriales bacterium]MCB0779208.1 glycosyltransferase family 39 protein [Flavobacteriales bacterium]MCB0783830.1 glycosyltransferase family 39 protein [Flavobacteriales bacterium]MCB0788214.1 glycosyltransferase family 39 protein [Flavobacteriales bacterium]MCB0809348.1 glycosyltransferase family 39 protein [Flavobacteriales bacterium]
MRRRRNKGPGGLAGFRRDLAGTFRELDKRTSAAHKRMVLLVIGVGALLRGMLMLLPVTHPEAYSFVHFGLSPWSEALSDRTLPGNHILHTLLVKVCASVLDVSEPVVRLPDLLAGILVLPLFYVFVRAMFNRYVALIALALVASSPPLVLYSALSEGIALGWLFLVLALLAGRHLVKENNPVSAVAMGLFLALGMWVDPDFLYPALMVLVWSVLYLVLSYSSTLGQRMATWSLVPVTAVLGTLLGYLPVIVAHGFGQVFDPGLGTEVADWSTFSATHQDGAVEVWLLLSTGSGPWLSLLGFAGVLAAMYISGKYRALLAGLVLGAVPAVVLRMEVPAAPIFLYSLLVLHLGSALALFTLLKFVQERFWPKLAKRTRTQLTALALLVGFGLFTVRGYTGESVARFAEAPAIADMFALTLKSDEVVLAQEPWLSPLRFYMQRRGPGMRQVSPDPMPRTPSTCYVVVAPGDGQDLDMVLRHHELDPGRVISTEKLRDRPRTEIFAVRMAQGRP